MQENPDCICHKPSVTGDLGKCMNGLQRICTAAVRYSHDECTRWIVSIPLPAHTGKAPPSLTCPHSQFALRFALTGICLEGPGGDTANPTVAEAGEWLPSHHLQPRQVQLPLDTEPLLRATVLVVIWGARDSPPEEPGPPYPPGNPQQLCAPMVQPL